MEKLLAGMEFYIHLFEDPHLLKSCLARTTVQESAETNPKLCDAANVCIANQEKRFKARLDEACKSRLLRLDTDSLAKLWIATIQGSLVLSKASKDESVIPRSLGHVRDYVRSLLERRG